MFRFIARQFVRFVVFLKSNPFLVLMVGAFLLLGVLQSTYHYGFPTVVGDEPPPMVAALKMIGTHVLRPAFPTFYYMPLSAYAAIPFVSVALGYFYIFGGISSIAAIQEFVILHFANILPAVRIASVIYGAIDIVLWYQIVLAFHGNKRRALLAAFLFGWGLQFFQISHFAKVWSLHMLFILISLYFTTKIWKGDTRARNYFLSAVGAVCAFGVNMIGGIVYFALPVVHYLNNKQKGITVFFDKRIIYSVVICVVGIGVMSFLNPYGFANYWSYIVNIPTAANVLPTAVIEGQTYSTETFNTPHNSWNFTYYPRIIFEYDPILALFAVIGFGVLFRRDRKLFAWMGSWTLLYFLFMSFLSGIEKMAYEPRYGLPLHFFTTLAAAFAVDALISRLGKKNLLLAQGFLLLFVVCYLAVPLSWVYHIALPGTRENALSWMIDNIPSDSKIITIDNATPIPENKESIEFVAKNTPSFVTVRRQYLLDHPEKIQHPAYFLYYPSYFRDTPQYDPVLSQAEFVLISWWEPSVRKEELEKVRRILPGASIELLKRFPDNARDDQRSLDLPNNMRYPAFRIWNQPYDGPVVDVYQVIYPQGE